MKTDKLTQRADQFDQCYNELSEKSRHAMDYRLWALMDAIDGLGELGARELLFQYAKWIERKSNNEGRTKGVKLLDMFAKTSAEGL